MRPEGHRVRVNHRARNTTVGERELPVDGRQVHVEVTAVIGRRAVLVIRPVGMLDRRESILVPVLSGVAGPVRGRLGI